MLTELLSKDMSQFIPIWKDEWTPPSELLDFEEKWATWHNPQGRLMSHAHRGDPNIFYPENSLEGMLSVIHAGADILEVDVNTAADGTLVLMHDSTLTRTTNLTMLRENGQADDLPTSDKIIDWRFDQIRRLRLLFNGKPTEYQVPSLKEVIMAAKDRVFITLDKFRMFDWDKSVYPLIKELRAYHTVVINYNEPVERAYEIQRKMFEEFGVCAPCYPTATNMVKGWHMDYENMRNNYRKLEEFRMPKILRGGEYVPEKESEFKEGFAPFRGRCRLSSDNLLGRTKDWEHMDELGIGIIMTNDIYDLIKYISNRYFQTDK